MKRTEHLFGLHSNDLGMLPTLLLKHFMKLQIQKKVVRKVVRKNSQTTLKKVYILIIIIKKNPSITRKQLVKATGKASSYIQRCINQLKETKRIQRVGPDKGGFWEIIE